MKPYGREKVVRGGRGFMAGNRKKDNHCHDKNHRKLENWWEDFNTCISRTTIKQKLKKQLEK